MTLITNTAIILGICAVIGGVAWLSPQAGLITGGIALLLGGYYFGGRIDDGESS